MHDLFYSDSNRFIILLVDYIKLKNVLKKDSNFSNNYNININTMA